MRNIAIIITAFNRKEKTLICLERLRSLKNQTVKFDTYLTDDGSSDGTYEEVSLQYPDVIISRGNGKLYWCGGMNLSWEKAIYTNKYDGYLWLNDDTYLQDNLFEELKEADEYCIQKYGKRGIYVGSTTDKTKSFITYGGSVFHSKIRNTLRKVIPNGTFQLCHIANGNILFVADEVVKAIGCLYREYVHGADYDYTYWAYTKGFPLLVLKNYVGICDNDHKSLKDCLLIRSLPERIKFLYSPTGMQLKTALLFQKRFFPYRIPYVFLTYWLKAIFPKIMKS